MSFVDRICLVGFGEVGQILAADLRARNVSDLSAWDIRFPDAASVPARAVAASALRAGTNAADAIGNAQLVISAVTAANDIDAAREAAEAIGRGAWFLDLNSVSPEVKKQAATLIEARGGRYVEAAVMSPIHPQRSASPILLGGPHAADFLPCAHSLGFEQARVFSPELGRASAAKMCRSVMVKGMEALFMESLLCARCYGVEQTVLDSLQDLFPGENWRARAHYMISRSLLHGRRRGEEMREASRTVSDAGVDPWMSAACARRQDWAAAYPDAASFEKLERMLDVILAARP